MTATLQIFSRALQMPDLAFATLTDARPLTDSSGMPRLLRTTRFVEALIEWQDRQWLLSMPLSPASMHRIARSAPAIRRLHSELLADYRILPDELHWTDAAGQEQSCDLTIQLLPEGRDFEEALLTEEPGRLLEALDKLEAGLREMNFSHNNLKATNLRWSAGRWVPLRYYDARISDADHADAEAFEELRHRISESSGQQEIVSDTTATYDARRPLAGHVWTSHEFEGLICVEDADGYGYVDAENHPVIPARFLWADDFHEGRAEVETPTGMGLIDREGNFIIPPEYEIVDYNHAESTINARKKGQWSQFDYLGRPICKAGTINEYTSCKTE